MLNVNKLLDSYQRYWWSPLPGSNYVMPICGALIGPGLVAHRCPAAFNLFWLLSNLPEPNHPGFLEAYKINIMLYPGLERLALISVNKVLLADWATNLNAKEFANFFNDHYPTIERFPRVGTIADAGTFNRKLQKAVAQLA